MNTEVTRERLQELRTKLVKAELLYEDGRKSLIALIDSHLSQPRTEGELAWTLVADEMPPVDRRLEIVDQHGLPQYGYWDGLIWRNDASGSLDIVPHWWRRYIPPEMTPQRARELMPERASQSPQPPSGEVESAIDELIHAVRSNERSDDKYTREEIQAARRAIAALTRQQGEWIAWRKGDPLPAQGQYVVRSYRHDDPAKELDVFLWLVLEIHGSLKWWPLEENSKGRVVTGYIAIPDPRTDAGKWA